MINIDPKNKINSKRLVAYNSERITRIHHNNSNVLFLDSNLIFI